MLWERDSVVVGGQACLSGRSLLVAECSNVEGKGDSGRTSVQAGSALPTGGGMLKIERRRCISKYDFKRY